MFGHKDGRKLTVPLYSSASYNPRSLWIIY